jgi:hypothetical protein
MISLAAFVASLSPSAIESACAPPSAAATNPTPGSPCSRRLCLARVGGSSSTTSSLMARKQPLQAGSCEAWCLHGPMYQRQELIDWCEAISRRMPIRPSSADDGQLVRIRPSWASVVALRRPLGLPRPVRRSGHERPVGRCTASSNQRPRGRERPPDRLHLAVTAVGPSRPSGRARQMVSRSTRRRRPRSAGLRTSIRRGVTQCDGTLRDAPCRAKVCVTKSTHARTRATDWCRCGYTA